MQASEQVGNGKPSSFPAGATAEYPVELFVSDPHGEYEELSYILRSACGLMGPLVDSLLEGKATQRQCDELAAFICYPHETVAAWEAAGTSSQKCSSIAPHISAVGTALGVQEPQEALDHTPAPLIELAKAIQRACVSRVHVVGDIFDRGPMPGEIIDELSARCDVDIQWGNHDIVWMGAALGQPGCIAHVVRNCARYGNLSILTDSYGIDLSALEEFALEAYADDPCVAFGLKGSPCLPPSELELNVKIQKAMAIIQFKVEAALIDANPSFGLQDRKLLHRIDFAAGTVELDGVVYPLTDAVFPTVDTGDPYALTEQEATVVAALARQFCQCDKLQEHMRFLLRCGSLYKVLGDTLLFHACVPLEADGSLKQVNIYGKTCAGKALFDEVERYVRLTFDDTADQALRDRGRDLLWYLWLGQGSPLFAKSKMATFELYLIAQKEARIEVKNPFYSLLEDEQTVNGIFEDFGIDAQRGRIVCGHVPVKVVKGENPVKCRGKVLIIDGGMSKPYQKTTGVAGFTLVKTKTELWLATHESFAGLDEVVSSGARLASAWERVR